MKIALALFVSCLLLSLSACGGSSNSNTVKEQEKNDTVEDDIIEKLTSFTGTWKGTLPLTTNSCGIGDLDQTMDVELAVEQEEDYIAATRKSDDVFFEGPVMEDIDGFEVKGLVPSKAGCENATVIKLKNASDGVSDQAIVYMNLSCGTARCVVAYTGKMIHSK